MKRVVLVVGAAAFVAGCWNFDEAYGSFCDGGRCAVGMGGSGGSGGGMAGGAGGGAAGGREDSGTSDGGNDGGRVDSGRPDAGPPDAGCPDVLCPALEFTGTRSAKRYFSYNPIAAGVKAESLDRFRVYSSFDARPPAGQNSTYSHFTYDFFPDASAMEVARSAQFTPAYAAQAIEGESFDDTWYAHASATHLVNDVPTSFYECKLPGGGETSGVGFWGLETVSAQEAYVVGFPGAMCRWTPDAGLVSLTDPAANPSLYLYDAYRTPAGELYAVGGDDLDDTVGTILNGAGQRVQNPGLIDYWYTMGYSSITGVGESVWVVARQDNTAVGNPSGAILERQDGGSFGVVWRPGFRLAAIDASQDGRAFAVGASNNQIAYFDGRTWSNVRLPNTDARLTVQWESVETTNEGLILGGFEEQADGGHLLVVNTYRFFGH